MRNLLLHTISLKLSTLSQPCLSWSWNISKVHGVCGCGGYQSWYMIWFIVKHPKMLLALIHVCVCFALHLPVYGNYLNIFVDMTSQSIRGWCHTSGDIFHIGKSENVLSPNCLSLSVCLGLIDYTIFQQLSFSSIHQLFSISLCMESLFFHYVYCFGFHTSGETFISTQTLL